MKDLVLPVQTEQAGKKAAHKKEQVRDITAGVKRWFHNLGNIFD